MKSSADSPSRLQPVNIALLGFAFFVLAVPALYFLNPAYNLLASFVGNYDLGPYEFLIASTFFSLGLASLALAIGLHQGLPHSVRSLVGLILLGGWGVGMLIAGIFPANQAGSTVPHVTTILIAGLFPARVAATPETASSFIHILAILGSVFSLSLAAILLSGRLEQAGKWLLFDRLAFILAPLMLAASLLICSAVFFPNLHILHGQLVFIEIGFGMDLLWLLLMAARLHFRAAGTVWQL